MLGAARRAKTLAEAIAPDEGGPAVTGEVFERFPHSGESFGLGVFVARTHYYPEADAQISHKIAVINRARTSRLFEDYNRFLRPLGDPKVASP